MNTAVIESMLKDQGYSLKNVYVCHNENKPRARNRYSNYSGIDYDAKPEPIIEIELFKNGENVNFRDRYNDICAFARDMTIIGEIIEKCGSKKNGQC